VPEHAQFKLEYYSKIKGAVRHTLQKGPFWHTRARSMQKKADFGPQIAPSAYKFIIYHTDLDPSRTPYIYIHFRQLRSIHTPLEHFIYTSAHEPRRANRAQLPINYYNEYNRIFM